MGEESSEIDEMLEGLIPEEKPPEKPPEEAPPVEAPPEEKPPEEAPPEEKPPEEPPMEKPPEEKPPEEPPSVEKPPEEPPVEKPPVEETPEEKLTRIEEQNRLLLERVDLLSTPEHLRPAPPVEKPPEEKPPVEVPPVEKPPAPAPKPAEPVDFIGDAKIEDLVDTKEGLNKLLNVVMGQAGNRNVDVVVEKILTSIPQLVAGQIAQQTVINDMVKDFYAANEDLGGAKRTVGIFANEVHSENPDWETKKVFEEAGTRTRKALGLRERAVNPPKRKPAFAKQRGARKGGDVELTGMAKDIDELISEQ